MMMRLQTIISTLAIAVVMCAATPTRANEMPVPARCTPEMNAVLAGVAADRGREFAGNVLVCGIVTEATSFAIELLPYNHETIVSAPVSNGPPILINILTNDLRNGAVFAKKGDQIEAFGGYFKLADWWSPWTQQNLLVIPTGAHHNGWIAVNGIR